MIKYLSNCLSNKGLKLWLKCQKFNFKNDKHQVLKLL